MDWLLGQWNDIKGNVKFALLSALWLAVVELAKRLLRYIPNIPSWAIWAILLVLSFFMFFLLIRTMKHDATKCTPAVTQDTGLTVPAIPTLSALLGHDFPIVFDVKDFFARAYYSPVTAEAEKNIKVIAQQTSPNDKEAFYARFIGVGAVAFQHEVTWYTIFKSQLSLLADLSARGTVLPVAGVRKYYDKAASDYPLTYANYAFDQWMNYMHSRFLIVTHPGDWVDLTHGGKDFLRFIAHQGWNVNAKAN